MNFPIYFKIYSISNEILYRGNITFNFKNIFTVIVIASHKDKTTANYWNLTRRMPLQENAIMAWKFCHVSHKLLRDGYKSVNYLAIDEYE